MNNIYVKLAKTNIRNNKPLYLPYIFSGVMTVAMFYMMMFLNGNDGISKIPGAANLRAILGLGVGVIAVFAYIFIFYTNSFIIKRRKKEIGVYNILGMEKRHIAKVLGMETLFVAILSIAGGLVAGILLSKLMLMLLYRILGFAESVVFFVTKDGIVYSCVIFGILYFLTLFYNLMQIRMANPIELLRGSNVGEKEPKTKVFMAIEGIVCIAIAYTIAIITENPMKVISLFFVAVLLVIAGTYSLFTAGSIAVLKLLRKNKKFYYNKRHFTAVSGLLYRMKQNAAGLASICILSTMVLVMLSTTVSMYAGVSDELEARYPKEITVYSTYNGTDIAREELERALEEVIRSQGRKITGKTSYTSLEIMLKKDGSNFEAAQKKALDRSLVLVTVVTKENLMAMDESLTEEEFSAIPQGMVSIYSSEPYPDSTVNLLGREFAVAENKVYNGGQDRYMEYLFGGVYYIVTDSEETFDEIFLLQQEKCGENSGKIENVTGYDIDGSKEEKVSCGNAVRGVLGNVDTAYLTERYSECRTANEEDFYTVYGGLFFLGIFLGVMFLMVTVMIIFYKQISEGYDDKDRYEIMEKVGMSNAEVKASIQSQVRMVFFLPLVTAAIHVAAAFPMICRLLEMLNLYSVSLFRLCLVITLLVFAVIYYLVFRLTSRAYYKIVGNRNR